MLALTTAFFTLREERLSAEAMVREARDLGFGTLELDYRVNARQGREFAALLGRGQVQLCSVHHPFPRPAGVPPARAHQLGPRLASLDPYERRAALRLGEESLAWAADLGVPAVVVHLGTAALPPGVAAEDLEGQVRAGVAEGPGYAALLQEFRRARALASVAHLDAVLSSLDRLGGEALRRGVRLGLENRYHGDEIPAVGELEVIFRELDGAPLGYWHDTGHGASLEAVGILADQVEPLERFRERLLGFHLHDARGLDDHLAPGEGALEFARFARYAVDGVTLVLEVHPKSDPAAVAEAHGVLAAAGFATG